MDIFNLLVLVFVLSIFWYLKKIRIDENYVEELRQKLEKVIIVNIETHHNQFYFWNKETGEFIAQGKQLEDVAALCLKRFPNKTFLISKEDVEKYNFQIKT